MKKLIFGGSFDPIHLGHIKVALKAKEVLKVDKVIFMIAKTPRWKKVSATDCERLDMLKLALSSYQDFDISLLEYNSDEETNLTFNTITKYLELHPHDELYFLIGYDQLEKFDKWYNSLELSQICHIVSFNRPEYNPPKEFIEKYHIQIIDEPVSNMSSSLFREGTNFSVPKSVLEYVIKNELYFVKKVKSYLNDKRYKHSLNVALTAYKIALSNGYNPYKAFQAGYLHDIGKYIDIEKQKEIIRDYDESLLEVIDVPLYHQFTGADIANKEFYIEDEEILHAIRFHATGCENMSVLDKIIYASDKIEPGRDYDSSHLIKACEENIETGFIKVLKENIEFFEKKGFIDYKNPLTLSCINQYLKGE